MDPVENAIEENRRLRRTMRDLVALSTLPAVWTGLDPKGIARSLADVLLHALALSSTSGWRDRRAKARSKSSAATGGPTPTTRP